MHHAAYENDGVVPVHYDRPYDEPGENENVSPEADTRADVLKALAGYTEWVQGRYASQSHKNCRYRSLAATWVTNPSIFRQFKQKDFARRHKLNPESFCRSVANFSKTFGIVNERMKPRRDRSTYTYGGRRMPAQPRKRMPRPSCNLGSF